jgi:hypothetical protein
VGVGYLTRVRGLSAAQLFTTAPATSANDKRASDPGPARLTFYAAAEIGTMSVLGSAISSSGSASVRIYHQANGGARFEDPQSFRKGVLVATLTGEFQNDLSVIAPDTANVNMSGDLTQKTSKAFTIGGSAVRFGSVGFAWALRATGRGLRTDAATPRSEHTLSGDLGVVDATPRR